MHAVTYGVSRDQMIARPGSKHIQCVYANIPNDVDQALLVKAQKAAELGMDVHLCGRKLSGKSG